MGKKKKRLNFSAANIAIYITIIAGVVTIIGFSMKDVFLGKKTRQEVKSDTVTHIGNQANIGTVNGTVINANNEKSPITITIDNRQQQDTTKLEKSDE